MRKLTLISLLLLLILAVAGCNWLSPTDPAGNL